MDIREDRFKTVRVGVDGRFVVLRWHAKPTVETVDFAFERMQQASEDHGPLVMLSVHHASDPMPGPSAVAAIVRHAPAVIAACDSQIDLLVGHGFGASIAHAIFGRVLLVTSPRRIQVVRSLEEATRLVALALEVDEFEVAAKLEKHALLPVPAAQ